MRFHLPDDPTSEASLVFSNSLRTCAVFFCSSSYPFPPSPRSMIHFKSIPCEAKMFLSIPTSSLHHPRRSMINCQFLRNDSPFHPVKFTPLGLLSFPHPPSSVTQFPSTSVNLRGSPFILKPEKRGLDFLCYYDNSKNNQPTPPKVSEEKWRILQRWDVPWPWQTFVLTNLACALSFVLIGFAESSVLTYLGFQGGDLSLDEKAELLFVNQFIVTAAILGVTYGITNTFQPLPDDVFRYSLKEPFDLKNGWLLWAGVGLVVAIVAIALAGSALTVVNGGPPQRETDALMRLLPLVGSSNISTACLLGITGVLAPVLEETVFRGFLLVTLTKWLPTPVSVVASAALFAIAHLTPGEFPQLFVLGCALGFSYSQTRNLMTPITIHAFWNSGVILLLTFLQLQGYDVKELLQGS